MGTIGFTAPAAVPLNMIELGFEAACMEGVDKTPG
jgi:hypothetical protein